MNQDYVIQASKIQKIQELEKGGFGVVYKGLMQGCTDVAIKEFYNQSISQSAMKELEQEIAIAQNSHHPNILQLYGYCQSPLCLIMELLTQSLFDLLHSKKELNWDLRYKLSLEIVLGLEHIHGKNIIHRYLKSKNILLDKSFQAKITDFGFSRIRVESIPVLTKNLFGNIRWMAPELMSSKPQYSKQSDIFALGVIFWEIASRKIPFSKAQDELIQRGIKSGLREEMPENCPAEYQGLIERCWTQNPIERATLEVVQTQLLSCLKKVSTQKNELGSVNIQQQLSNLIIAKPEENKQVLKPQMNQNQVVQTQPLQQKTIMQIKYKQSQDKAFPGHSSDIRSLAVSPDNQFLISGSGEPENSIKIWNFQSGTLLRTIKGHTDSVFSLVISADQKLLVSGSKDKTIKVWNFEAGTLLRTIEGHTSYIQSVFITTDQKLLASGSEDNTIKI